jgi:ABC-type antimicrobial peptide transport system permease subunit
MLGPFNNPNVDASGYYVPFYAAPAGPSPPGPAAGQFATLVVKPRGGRMDTIAQTLRRDVTAVDPNLPLYFVGTPRQQVDSFIAQNRIIATLFAIFGGVALVLAAVGLYGVMSFSVNQRRQELGVRMALGADRRRILLMVLRQSAVQVALGTLVGVGLAFGLARAAGAGIQTVLFDTSATDPATYATVVALIVSVSFVAAAVPARRATRVDPMIALRME